MARRRFVVVFAVVLSCAAAIAPGSLGAPPTITHETIDVTFEDEFLTDFCGVPVESHATGKVTIREYEEGGRLVAGATVNVTIVSTSDFGTVRFRDVGADLTRVTKDGLVHQVIGKLPFDFNGTLWEDPITGEILKEATGPDLFESMLEDACAALAP